MPAFMRGTSLWQSPVILALAVFLGISPSSAAAQSYEITNLGTLCDPEINSVCTNANSTSRAFDINNSGRVVGTSSYPSTIGENDTCFRTASNATINLATDRLVADTLGPIHCVAYSINDNNSVVGIVWNPLTPDYENPKAFGYGDHMTTLDGSVLSCPFNSTPALGCLQSYAFGINKKGTVVGTASTRYPEPAGVFHAFRVNMPADHLDDLGALPLPNLENFSDARGVNELNIIVGSSWTVPGGVVQRAALFYLGDVFDLGTLGGSSCTFCSSAANAINNVGFGEIVGWSRASVSGPRHAFLFKFANADMLDLGDLCKGEAHGLCRSEAFAINDFTQIVGESQWEYGSQSTHAFVYRAQTGVMEDLNHLLSPVDRVLWELTDARGINDLGQIVGTGVHAGEEIRAYRLDPLPPQLVTNIGHLLEHFNLADRGVEQSLRAKLRAIQIALQNNRASACGQIGAFDHEVRAQRHGLTQHQASIMMAGAALLERQLTCR